MFDGQKWIPATKVDSDSGVKFYLNGFDDDLDSAFMILARDHTLRERIALPGTMTDDVRRTVRVLCRSLESSSDGDFVSFVGGFASVFGSIFRLCSCEIRRKFGSCRISKWIEENSYSHGER